MKRKIPLGGRLALVLSGLLPLAAGAQAAHLVRDLNTAPSTGLPAAADVTFAQLLTAGSRLYFDAVTADEGREIWVSDGTSSGTDLLRDSCPGACTAVEFRRPLNGLLLVGQRIDDSHHQIWRTDGTLPGTFPLTDGEHTFDAPFGARTVVADFRGATYFSFCTGPESSRDCDLWRTDGTTAGTALFQAATERIVWIQPASDSFYFATAEGATSSLWVSDGTAAGTKRLLGFSGVQVVSAAVGRRLFFLAVNDGEELWTSDGTAAGTVALTDFVPSNPFQGNRWLRVAGGSLYFTADDGVRGRELWRSDGTRNGTVRLTQFPSPTPFDDSFDSRFLAVAGTTPVFWARGDGTSQLWAKPGAQSSLVPLLPRCETCLPSPDQPLVESGGKIYFAMRPLPAGEEIWVTDGTVAGTRRLSNACADGDCGYQDLQAWKGGLLFRAVGFREDVGWISDGTPAGTRPYLDLPGAKVDLTGLRLAELGGAAYFLATVDDAAELWAREANGRLRLVACVPSRAPSSDPLLFAAAGNQLLFQAQPGELGIFSAWLSGGTEATTRPLDLGGGSLSSNPGSPGTVQSGGLLYFQTRESSVGGIVHNLWRSDGTEAGTYVVAHLQSEAPMAAWQGGLLFFDGGWIWRSDGSVAGTVKTGDIPPGLGLIGAVRSGPNAVYIAGSSASSLLQVWTTDGTTAGTRLLAGSTVTGSTSGPWPFAVVGPDVYFTWIDGIWKSDGTPAGTRLVQSLPNFEYPVTLTAFQGALIYASAAPESPVSHLWRTDGTAAGTLLLGTFPAQDVIFGENLRFAPLGGNLYFNLDDGIHGKELMVTDGTPAGTKVAVDLVPGRKGSGPADLMAAEGRLYFAAGDSLHGRELWSSDGSPGGTRLVQDVAPQALSSSPRQLTVAGGSLYFAADDGITGRELWVLPLAGPSGCQASSVRLCLNGGRYAVEAAWRTPDGATGVGRSIPLAGDTGAFWFFAPANVEAVIKVLDGRGVNDHVWVFYGALSDVEYSLTVTDTETGLSHRYTNPQGQLASVADTQSFGPNGANAAVGSVVSAGLAAKALAPLSPADRRVVARAATGSCAPSSSRLCLNGGRYAVEVAWKDFSGNSGTGQAVGLTGDTGYFWFFNAANVELVLKVLDGTAVNGHRWVFYGALSSVEYTVTVTDTETGEIKTYRNPSGNLASVADTEAF